MNFLVEVMMMFTWMRPIAALFASLATATVFLLVYFLFEHASGQGWT